VRGCSSAEQSSRSILAEGVPIVWVHLTGAADLIRWRLQHRTGHYMKEDMLPSQFGALETPSHAIVVDVAQSPGAIVEQVLNELGRPTHTEGGTSTRPTDRG
jgi:gluconokinase